MFFFKKSTYELKKAELKQIIDKLDVTDQEKELYRLCLEMLNQQDFDVFYAKFLPNRAENENKNTQFAPIKNPYSFLISES